MRFLRSMAVCLAVAFVFSGTTVHNSLAAEIYHATTASDHWLDQAVDDYAADAGMADDCGDDCDSCASGRCRKRLCDQGTLFTWAHDPDAEGGPPGMDEPLVTDRPDFTEASVPVGRGVAQLEFGYTYIFDDEPGERFKGHSIGEPLLRIGVFAEWLELRLGWNYVEETTTTVDSRELLTGAADMFVGLKIGLTPQSGLLPEMALIPQLFLPTGTGDLSANEVQPGLIWIYAWEVNNFISTAGSTQGNRVLDDATGDPFVSIAQSWTIAYTLTERLGMYTEWFAFFPTGADTEQVEHFADGGFTYLLSNNVQYDVRAGIGLNNEADDYFVGTGFSIRF